MYDFHYGSKDQIRQNPEEFLIFVKRLLPRWINGIPDSECVAIYRTLVSMNKKDSTLIETGCGASTLAMFLYAVLNDAHIFSWDTNGSRGSFLRSVISEAICRPLEVDLYRYWSFIGFNSTDPHVGITMIKEIDLSADFGFFDSWHTLDQLSGEVECFIKIASQNFYLAIDDAYYKSQYQNFSYINMIRQKLNLSPVSEPDSNYCRPFYVEVEEYLTDKFESVDRIDDDYKKNYQEDIFFKY
ncbi:uncharacterized protein METZ01_LOCUS265218, partial [marine metagenome]